MANIGHFIAGQVTQGAPGDSVSEMFNPATGQVSGQVSLAGATMVDKAVAAATAAFPAWSNTPALRRAHVLFRFRELLMQRRGELAAAITAEHGKVLADADGEVTRGIEIVEFACGVPRLLSGVHSDNVGGGIDNWNLR